MNVVFASNYLNIHQNPLCEEMQALLGADNFKFIASSPFNMKRLTSGYEDMNQKPFVIRAYEDPSLAQEAVLSADVMIGIPYANDPLIDLRMRKSDKPTFIYSERLLKRGLWFRHVPQKRSRVDAAFTRYSDFKNLHVLCASAFTSYDLSLFGFPTQRCWKWGYFPRVPTKLFAERRPTAVPSLLWVGRFIEFKRPFMPLRLARRLMREGRSFHLTMVGDGELRSAMEDYIRANGLDEVVSLTGSIPNDMVQRIMGESDIFLLTSNREEGWGAVLSEAMGNGCCPVASSLVGAAPYLIGCDGSLGKVFADGDSEELYRCVSYLLEHPEIISEIGNRAHELMATLWNPRTASQRFCDLAEVLNNGEIPAISEGPCSPAGIIRDSWWNHARRGRNLADDYGGIRDSIGRISI